MKQTPAPTKAVTVSAAIHITVKGTKIELTHDEAKQLALAISAIVGVETQDDKLEEIRKKVEQIRNRPDPSPYRQPQEIPMWPIPPRTRHPWEHDIWCSTDSSVALSLAPVGEKLP